MPLLFVTIKINRENPKIKTSDTKIFINSQIYHIENNEGGSANL